MPNPSIDPSMAASFALALALIEILKMTINKIRPGLNGRTLNPDEREAILELRDLHRVKDADGLPMWYIPRGWNERQEEELKLLQLMNSHLKNMVILQNKTIDLIVKLNTDNSIQHGTLISKQGEILRMIERGS